MDDDKLVEFLLEIRGSLGELKEGQKNTHAYVAAVSDGQKSLRADFAAHVVSLEAHGANASEKRDSKWLGFLALGISAANAAWGLLEKKLGTH